MNNSDKTPIKNTIGMFDLSRGILMIAVIMSHSVTMFFKYWEPQYMEKWWYPLLIVIKPVIYGIMPMFFIMSGYGFRKKPVMKCIKDRSRYLIKPYLFTAALVTLFAILKCVLTNGSIKETIWYYTVPFVLGLCPGLTNIGSHYVGSIGPVWFLVVLLLGWIILNLVFQLKSEGTRALCLLGFMLVCTRLPFIAFMPFCLVQSLCGAFYFYIGYIVKKYNLLNEKLSKQNLIVLLVIVCLVMPFGNIEISQNVWALGSLDFMAGAVTGFLFLKLFCYGNRFQGKFINALRVVGRYSLHVLCIHAVEYLVFPWDMISVRLMDHKLVGILVTFVIRSVMIATGCFLVQLYIGFMKNKKKK